MKYDITELSQNFLTSLQWNYGKVGAVEPIETVEQQLAALKVEQEEQNSQIAYIGMMTEVV